MILRRLSYANVCSTLALVLATSGVAWAATLPRNSVGTAQLKAGSVTNAKLAKGSVGAGKLQAGAIQAGKVATGAIAGPQLADGAVAAAKLANGSVTNAKLADGSVTSGELADGAVTGPKLAAGSVTATQLAPLAVGPDNLSAATVAKYAPTAYHVKSDEIQQIGPNYPGTQVASLNLGRAGRYLVIFTIRAFPRVGNVGHNLWCLMNHDGPNFINIGVPGAAGAESQLITQQGFVDITSAADSNLALSCYTGAGEIT